VESSDEARRVDPGAGNESRPLHSGPRWLNVLPALLLVAVAAWEIVGTRCSATSVPEDPAWLEASAVVRAGYRPGDLIVFAPDWVDPVGRLHLGDLIPLDVAARMDADAFGRIWEVAIRGARAPETEGLTPVETAERGGVTVRRYERAPVEVLADLRDRVATTRVEKGGRGPTVELAEVGFAPHRCIQVVPTADIPMKIIFPGVPTGTELVGYVGIADVFTRRDNRKAALLDVEIGDRIVARARAEVDSGWVRFAGTTTPGTADITIVARSSGGNRLICFAVETRR